MFSVGIFFGTMSVNTYEIGWKCMGKKSVEDFRSCIQQNTKDYIKGINLKSFEQRTHLSNYSMYKVILPEDGSVLSKREPFKPTITLDPSLVYLMCLFDKDFLMYVDNSLIVQRSCLRISQNTYYTGIEIKVMKGILCKYSI